MAQGERRIKQEGFAANRLATTREAAPTDALSDAGERQSTDDYKGLLTVPMRQLGLLSLFNEEAMQERQNEKLKRIKLLFDHFGIDEASKDAWRYLALALAEKHVPGFQPPPRPQGRPKERAYDANTVVLLVKLLHLRDGLSVRAAIKKIVAAGCVSGSEERLRDLYKRAIRGDYTIDAKIADKFIDGYTKEYGPDFVISTLEKVVGDLLPPK